MIIGCTKKALDYIGVGIVEEKRQTDTLFSWTANLMIINRRKTLIVMNDNRTNAIQYQFTNLRNVFCCNSIKNKVAYYGLLPQRPPQ